MYCKECGAEINDKAVVCVKCGCSVKNDNNWSGSASAEELADKGYSPKSGLLFCF